MKGTEDRSKKLRWISKTLPVTEAAIVNNAIPGIQVHIPIPAKILVATVTAWISVAVFGVNKEEINSPSTGIACVRIIHVLSEKSIKGALG